MPRTGGGASSLQEMLGVVPAPPARVWVCLASGRTHIGFRTQFPTVCGKKSGYPSPRATSVLCVDMIVTTV